MKYSKFDKRYWLEKGLFKASFKTESGTLTISPYWSARMMHKGRHVSFALKTAIRLDAAAQASEIFAYLRHHGWQKTFEKYKPEKAQQLFHSERIETVGDFLDAVFKKADGVKPKTLEGYAASFRTIVGGIAGIPSNGGGGSRQSCSDWRKKVHAVKLANLTPAKVVAWKKTFLAKYPPDPLSQQKAIVSATSMIKSAKSLYSPQCLKFIDPGLAKTSPFIGVSVKREMPRYRSSFGNMFGSLTQDAVRELRENEPEQYKIFLLALGAGLRRSEIDKLEWSAFKWDQEVLRLEKTEHLELKSLASANDVDLDKQTLAEFKDLKSRSLSNFVITSDVAPRPNANYRHYRANAHHKGLINWLKSKGVKGLKPLHEMRKEFGSQIAETHGISIASDMLRHADERVTKDHYWEKRRPTPVGLGALLTPAPAEQKIIEGNF